MSAKTKSASTPGQRSPAGTLAAVLVALIGRWWVAYTAWRIELLVQRRELNRSMDAPLPPVL